jgi:hypothetical protein
VNHKYTSRSRGLVRFVQTNFKNLTCVLCLSQQPLLKSIISKAEYSSTPNTLYASLLQFIYSTPSCVIKYNSSANIMFTLAHHTAVLSCIFVVFRKATASQPCYWPNGTQTDSNSIACGSGTSQCCQVGSACLNNGLCFNPGDGIPYRGACTSQDWVAANTTSCPTFCSNWSQSIQPLLTNIRDKSIGPDASFWQMAATAGQN